MCLVEGKVHKTSRNVLGISSKLGSELGTTVFHQKKNPLLCNLSQSRKLHQNHNLEITLEKVLCWFEFGCSGSSSYTALVLLPVSDSVSLGERLPLTSERGCRGVSDV